MKGCAVGKLSRRWTRRDSRLVSPLQAVTIGVSRPVVEEGAADVERGVRKRSGPRSAASSAPLRAADAGRSPPRPMRRCSGLVEVAVDDERRVRRIAVMRRRGAASGSAASAAKPQPRDEAARISLRPFVVPGMAAVSGERSASFGRVESGTAGSHAPEARRGQATVPVRSRVTTRLETSRIACPASQGGEGRPLARAARLAALGAPRASSGASWLAPELSRPERDASGRAAATRGAGRAAAPHAGRSVCARLQSRRGGRRRQAGSASSAERPGDSRSRAGGGIGVDCAG